ncbi:bifunctional riboflavin kinase/FAD synthetase [Flavobacteriaceae bacterium Ap0902]|nr:bifunctional riboflavin kinase/FAD synthetase [Flavobacteriaceae bacterium Ap0902]
MKKILNISLFSDQKKTVLTLGMFDGVHKGHRAIIRRLNDIAAEKGAKSGLLTFDPHPRFVLQKDSDLKLLTLEHEKEQILDGLGLDYMIVQPFDFEFSRISSLAFVRDYLVKKLNVEVLVIGHDHHFGRNREGNFEKLSELAELYDFQLLQLDAIKEVDKPVSSTKIRNALFNGDLAYANDALGYNYFMSGTVIKGDGIGRKLGFPTINLKVAEDKLVPKDGVYGVKVKFNKHSYLGLMSIGDRPTFEGKDKRLEVFILNFEGNLYTEDVTIEFLYYIREQKKFAEVEGLIDAMHRDETEFNHWLESNSIK